MSRPIDRSEARAVLIAFGFAATLSWAVQFGLEQRWLFAAIAGVFAGFLGRLLFRTEPVPPVATCRECGCTDDEGCWPPCWWVEPDLCSSCAIRIGTL